MKKTEELWLEGGGMREVYTDEYVDTLLDRIAQMEKQEPVAEMTRGCAYGVGKHRHSFHDLPNGTLLYTAPVVPAGFKLVPIEPTQEMVDAIAWLHADARDIREAARMVINAAPEAGK